MRRENRKHKMAFRLRKDYAFEHHLTKKPVRGTFYHAPIDVVRGLAFATETPSEAKLFDTKREAIEYAREHSLYGYKPEATALQPDQPQPQNTAGTDE